MANLAWQTRKYKINYRRRDDSTLWSNAAAEKKTHANARAQFSNAFCVAPPPPRNYDFTKIPNYKSTGRLAPLFFYSKETRKPTTPHAKERGEKRKTPIETPETVATSQPAREIRAADVFIPTKKHSLQYEHQSVLQRCKYKGIRRHTKRQSTHAHHTHFTKLVPDNKTKENKEKNAHEMFVRFAFTNLTPHL